MKKNFRFTNCLVVVSLFFFNATTLFAACVMTGTPQAMMKLVLTCEGPQLSESSGQNPFMDYKMDVVFQLGKQQLKIPGFYAADGKAGETGASSGNKWKVYFRPPQMGTWDYSVSFRTGKDIATELSSSAGTSAGYFDGYHSTIRVNEPVSGALLSRGRLEYVSDHYLKFSLSGESFIKSGTDEPENFLAYADFDNTKSSKLHYFSKHVKDWKSGDPTWKNGKGKGIIGAINYLASRGVNSLYFLTYGIDGGDGNDVHMWVKGSDKSRFDVSRLDQWDLVFDHMSTRGVMLHVVMSEMENHSKIDNGELGKFRKLYFRELVARLGNHPLLTWNIGEEFTLGPARAKEFAARIRALDPYKNFIVLHTGPKSKDKYYPYLLGDKNYEGASLQIVDNEGNYRVIRKYVEESAAAGRPWIVTHDESGPVGKYGQPDSVDSQHNYERIEFLWGTLMAKGAGVEWILFGPSGNKNLEIEDFRTRQKLWDMTRYAVNFFQFNLNFSKMKVDNEVTEDTKDWVLSESGQTYVVYRKSGGSTKIKLPRGKYSLKWFDPRKGGSLQQGLIKEIQGELSAATGEPPYDKNKDWVILIKKGASL